jgi:ribosomal protein S6--L-glutamate ligase
MRSVIALGSRLRACRNVRTLGVRPDFFDYTLEEREAILLSEKIYYPSLFYADLFDAAGKAVFPSYHTYKCAQDKIKQSALFHLCRIPHPRTRIFFGKRQVTIRDHFDFPFIGKVARGSSRGRGVFMIRNDAELSRYCRMNRVAYIQEYLPGDRDIRAVFIGDRVVHAYWRISPPEDFRSNLAIGGAVSIAPVPGEAVALACRTARSCGWNDVGIDIRIHRGDCFVLEANMIYGREGFRSAGIDYPGMMETMIENGEL